MIVMEMVNVEMENAIVLDILLGSIAVFRFVLNHVTMENVKMELVLVILVGLDFNATNKYAQINAVVMEFVNLMQLVSVLMVMKELIVAQRNAWLVQMVFVLTELAFVLMVGEDLLAQ